MFECISSIGRAAYGTATHQDRWRSGCQPRASEGSCDVFSSDSSDVAVQQIKKSMPHADFSKFDADPDVNKMPDLFTVKTLVNYIQTKLAA